MAGATSQLCAWASAWFVSSLWGLLHLPILSAPQGMAIVILPLVPFHAALGTLLSFSWRAGGTLLLPAFAYSMIDAYRSVVL